MQAFDDHDRQRLEEQPVRIDYRTTAPARQWWLWDMVDQAKQLDKNGFSGDHGRASGNDVLGHTPSSEAFRRRSSRLPAPFVIYDQPSTSQYGSAESCRIRPLVSTMAPRPG